MRTIERIKKIPSFVINVFRHLDPVLFACTSILSVISIVTLYGGRDDFGTRAVLMQAAMTIAGFFVTVVVANLEYQFIVEKLWPLFMLMSVGLLGLVLVFGSTVGTNKSWIEFKGLGLTVQPSEFVKASFIVTFSYHLYKVKGRINRPLTILGLGIHACVIIGLIVVSGDLGVALVYVGIMLVMLFSAGLSPLYYAGGLLLVGLAVPYIWPHLEDYQQRRIIVGFRPELDPLDKGFQPLLSKKAIQSGGFFGNGINGGSIYRELPVSESDFFFATFCEKFGFVGAFLLITVMVVLVIRLLWIGHIAAKEYGTYICAGIAGMVIVQATENIGMCLAMLPVIGITLPFLSAGGSSILAINLTVAMAHSVYSHRLRKSYTYTLDT